MRPDQIEHAAIITLGILVWVGMIWMGLRWLRRFKARDEAIQHRAFEDVSTSDKEGKGRVQVVFHTYSGFLVFVVQREYRFWADPEEARETLWRLHKHNCTRGLFAYGGLIVPLLSYGNYLAQKRSIGRQDTSIAWQE